MERIPESAISKAKGENIVSGQSLFAPDELAYIADHFIYLDHDQRYSLSGGLTYRFGANRISGDIIYGSGLRNTPDGAPPNSGKLPAYTTMNVTFVHQWNESPIGDMEGRVGITQSVRQDLPAARRVRGRRRRAAVRRTQDVVRRADSCFLKVRAYCHPAPATLMNRPAATTSGAR